MIATENTHSLADFRAAVDETLNRVNATGEAEIITVDGQPRGVLLAAAVYDNVARDAQLSRDVAMMQQAMKEIAEGKGVDARKMFDDLRLKLLTIKAAQAVGGFKRNPA